MYGIPTTTHTLPRIFRFYTLATLRVAKVVLFWLFSFLHCCNLLIFSRLRPSLCAKVKPYGFTCPCPYMGVHTQAWAGRDTPKIDPIFYENCPYTQTPIHTHLRLLCAHNACVVVPERQRVALAHPVARRVWRCVCASRHTSCACPSAYIRAHNARPSPTRCTPNAYTCGSA